MKKNTIYKVTRIEGNGFLKELVYLGGNFKYTRKNCLAFWDETSNIVRQYNKGVIKSWLVEEVGKVSSTYFDFKNSIIENQFRNGEGFESLRHKLMGDVQAFMVDGCYKQAKETIDFAKELDIFEELYKNLDAKFSKSPYSNSAYLCKFDEEIGWGEKPDGSYRIADHWNWDGGLHCPTLTNEDYGLCICKMVNGKYVRLDDAKVV